ATRGGDRRHGEGGVHARGHRPQERLMHNDAVFVLVIATALAFDFTNGFHDTANVVATSISTRAMSPRLAVAVAAPVDFRGAFVAAAIGILVVYRVVGALRPGPVTGGFKLGQLGSGALLALAHGTNDAQKTMGVITLALVAHGNIPADNFHVPEWVVITAASAIAIGTYSGGWRIIKTMG